MVVPGTLHCSAVNRTGYLMWPLMKTQVDCCSQPVTKPCAFGTPLLQKIFGRRGFMLNVSGVWHILTMEDGWSFSDLWGSPTEKKIILRCSCLLFLTWHVPSRQWWRRSQNPHLVSRDREGQHCAGVWGGQVARVPAILPWWQAVDFSGWIHEWCNRLAFRNTKQDINFWGRERVSASTLSFPVLESS